jgi:hypothetical protein
VLVAVGGGGGVPWPPVMVSSRISYRGVLVPVNFTVAFLPGSNFDCVCVQ